MSEYKELVMRDYQLARKLAGDIALLGGTEIDAGYDEIQNRDGFTFEVGRDGTSSHWERVENYRAEDWQGVKDRVQALLANQSFLDQI